MNLDGIERLDLIRGRLDTASVVRVVELAAEHKVSEMTIRRDLDLLVQEGVARRVRGGATAVGPQQFATRYDHHARAKGKIGEKLIALVGDGGAVGIDASSTLQRLAARLVGARDLTVLTNGPDTFRSLSEHAGVTALLTGGQLDENTGSLVGPLATRAASHVLLRRLFVSCAALDPNLGSSESTLPEAEVKLALAKSATEVVLAVDTSKLGHRTTARCLEIPQISILVTDLDPGDVRLDPYRDIPLIL